MRTVTFVFCAAGAVALTGSVAFVKEFETVKSTVVSAPGARFAYGFDGASAVTPAGGVSATVPLCVWSDQLCTTTGTVSVPPTGMVWTAAERPRRLASGTLPVSHWSYSCQLPQRWKRPSTPETTRTTWSV